ncbi:hypothetical protein BH23CHL8_BH23CHL8_08820 [soil metagenome]
MDAAQGIHDGNERFMQAVRTADREMMPSLYTTGATILPPNAAAVSGSDAIRDYWHAFFELGIAESRPLTLEVIPMGEYALEVGEFSAFRGDGSLVDRGKIMVLWKHEGGIWRMHRGESALALDAEQLPGSMVGRLYRDKPDRRRSGRVARARSTRPMPACSRSPPPSRTAG